MKHYRRQTVLIGLIFNHKWLLLQYVLRTNKDLKKKKEKKYQAWVYDGVKKAYVSGFMSDF